MDAKLEVIRINEDVIATSGNKCNEVAGLAFPGEGEWLYRMNGSNQEKEFVKGDYYKGKELDSNKMYHINSQLDIVGECPYSFPEKEYAERQENHNLVD